MDFDIKLKQKHYKKGRFNEKEKLLSEFKKDNITQDLNEIKQITHEYISFQSAYINSFKEIVLPKKNEVLSIRTQRQLNIFTFFLKMIEQNGSIDYLSIQTYTFDQKTLVALYSLLEENKIKNLQIIMTETAMFRIPKIYAQLKDLFSNHKRCNLVFYWVHSKVNLIESGGNKYVLDGSGNFSMNAQIEYYNLFNSEKMFDFDKEWQNEFLFKELKRKKHEIYKNF